MQREDRVRRQQRDERALLIYSAMRSALAQVKHAGNLFKHAEVTKEPGKEEAPTDRANIKGGTLRHAAPEFRGMSFDQIMNAGLAFPPPLALEISRVAFNTSIVYSACRCPETGDAEALTRQIVVSINNIIPRATGELERVISDIESVLMQRDLLPGK